MPLAEALADCAKPVAGVCVIAAVAVVTRRTAAAASCQEERRSGESARLADWPSESPRKPLSAAAALSPTEWLRAAADASAVAIADACSRSLGQVEVVVVVVVFVHLSRPLEKVHGATF